MFQENFSKLQEHLFELTWNVDEIKPRYTYQQLHLQIKSVFLWLHQLT